MKREIKVSTFDDKTLWGPGPWQEEPDKAEWVDSETLLPCLIVRGPMGALCGYVGVGADHPLFAVNYNDVDNFDVHGGLTFSDHCQKDGRICHEVSDYGDDDIVWWFGFDCAHYRDYMPKYKETFEKSKQLGPEIEGFFKSMPSINEGGTYRDFSYVKAEVESLARQLKKIKSK